MRPSDSNVSQNLIYIDLGDGLSPFGTKPLPKPMLTYYQLNSKV